MPKCCDYLMGSLNPHLRRNRNRHGEKIEWKPFNQSVNRNCVLVDHCEFAEFHNGLTCLLFRGSLNFGVDSDRFFLQGFGKSGHHGPDDDMQEDEEAPWEDGRDLQERTVVAEGDLQGGPVRNQRVPVPVQESEVELHDHQEESQESPVER